MPLRAQSVAKMEFAKYFIPMRAIKASGAIELNKMPTHDLSGHPSLYLPQASLMQKWRLYASVKIPGTGHPGNYHITQA